MEFRNQHIPFSIIGPLLSEAIIPPLSADTEVRLINGFVVTSGGTTIISFLQPDIGSRIMLSTDITGDLWHLLISF